MNPHLFADDKPGELRKFSSPTNGGEDWLFLPHDLPPAWEFPARLWPLLADARATLGTLNGIGRTLPNPNLLLRPLQVREAIASSAIEGTYVTPQQLMLYELDPQEPASEEGELADRKEVSNYRAALHQGQQLTEGSPVLNRHLLDMHRTLMSGVRGAQKSPGEFRRVQVQIGTSGKYVPPPLQEVTRLMASLERYINQPDEQFDPLVRCYLAHYQFEAIHPFSDGNGRIGRVLLALMTQHYHGHLAPWLYMSAFFEQHRREYTDHLFRISTTGDWESWIEFCLTGTIEQARDSIRRCDAFLVIQSDFHSRIEASASPRSHTIITWLLESPMLTIPAVAKRCEVSYPTAQADLERLVEAGILEVMTEVRPKRYVAQWLLEIAYEADE